MDSSQDAQIEQLRLASLKNLQILDTSYEKRFDRIVSLARKLFSVPISGIAFIDKDRIWYKSILGLQFRQVDRRDSFEQWVLLKNDGVLIINDTANVNLANNLLVASGPKIRFYAGFVIHSLDIQKVGVFFIADRIPREFSDSEKEALADLSFWAEREVNYNDLISYKRDSKYLETQQELSRKNRELAESKAKDKAMLENIGDGIIGLNDGGEIVYVNAQTEKMLGYSETELLGRLMIHAVLLVDEKDEEVAFEKRPMRIAMLSKTKVESREFFCVRKDKSKFAASITATPIVLYGNVIGGVCVFRDVTQEYEVDKMKTEFISLASHQLRTPLSAMKWFSEILLDGEAGELSSEQSEFVENIYKSNERMIELVDSLLNISRIESGRIIVDPQPTNLKNLVEEVIKEVRHKIDEKNQHLAVSIHDNLPEINIDPNLVRHVYMNILTNAVKYTEEGGDIEMIISKSGNEIISEISDNGYGIPRNQQDKIFTKFFRAQNIVKIVTDGTGLGLYLTKAIVESSGGKIWFKSEEGKGTTFWFSLPLSGSCKKEGEVTIDT